MAASTIFRTAVIVLIIHYAVSDSCVGRCGQGVNSAYNCQCNSACSRYNDCCGDYSAICLGATCSGRCGQTHDNSKPCQCNIPCLTYGDCCDDYSSLCNNGGGAATTAAPGSISDVIQTMWDRDVNRFPDTDAVIDPTSSKLFSYVNENRLSGVTFQAFINLLDNYVTLIGQAETITSYEQQEIDTFVDAIMQTEVMSLAYSYLEINGKVEPNAASFRSVFMELWFNLYSRSSSSSTLDSSGFEHVMVGETKSSTVSGLHSWVQFYLQEKNGNLQYSNMVTVAEPKMKGAAFYWYGKLKSMGSFFLGTSPEFDLGVYTVCALMYPNSRCNFNLQGHSVSIQTYDIAHKPSAQIGTAYPAI